MNKNNLMRRVAVTGGAGFIGSNLLLYLVKKYPDYLFINIDSLTYAGNLTNLTDIQESENYRFEKIDIADFESLADCFERHNPDSLIHLAAESHVDRSIVGPSAFVQTNILGTFNLLELARKRHTEKGSFRFHHVSTDEVFGSLGEKGKFTEASSYRPNSPYSASKAAGDHLVRSYHQTYRLDTVTSNCSNNYGPYQFPEKLVPLIISNALAGKELPVYGDGLHVRDWLFVEDHCRALDILFHEGKSGETYNIGGNSEVPNLELVRTICRMLDRRCGGGSREELMQFVEDRPGHDRRYAIDASRINREFNWQPEYTLEGGLEKTIDWYIDNSDWLEKCTSGEYREYYERMYAGR
jgi:dTDP-glucose 4,6-dehydratase